MQVCDYLAGQKPLDSRTQGHWQVLLPSLAVAPTWTAGPRSSTSASSLASPQALGLSYFIREAQVLKQLSGQLGPEGP